MKTSHFKLKTTALAVVLLAAAGCEHQKPSMKLQRASFNRCIYKVDQSNVCWDVRAFVDDDAEAEGEEFIISLNLVYESDEDQMASERIFRVKKVRVYFGTDIVYQGKRFDHHEWLGPSLGSTNNMLGLKKSTMGKGNLSVVVWSEDDLGRLYKCEAGNVKVGRI